jgi:cyclin L
MILDQNYINLKSQVIKAERRVLKELGFCVHVKHPHKLIVMYLKYLDFETHQQMMQTAWNYMNDSFRTDVFVRYQPETIACACIYLTARKLNIVLPNNQPHWFDIFKVTEEDIIDVCYRISALYRRTKPSLEELEDAVEKLKHKYQELRKNRPGINTPPLATVTADRNNGSHNAWGGFISRAVPVISSSNVTNNSGGHNNHGDNNNGNNDEDKDSTMNNNKKRSHSRSRSRSPRSRNHSRSKSKTLSRSHTPVDDKYGGGRKKTRNRSRTPKATSKKKSRNYSRSSSSSPHGKHKKR